MQDERPYRVVPSGPIAWLTPEEAEARKMEKEIEKRRAFLERQEELKKNAPQPWPAEQPIPTNNANFIRDKERLRALAEIEGQLAQGILPPGLSEDKKQKLADDWNKAKSKGKPSIIIDYTGEYIVGFTEDPWRTPVDGNGSVSQVTIKRDILAEMRENPLIEWAVKFGARYAGVKVVREELEQSFNPSGDILALTIRLACEVTNK